MLVDTVLDWVFDAVLWLVNLLPGIDVDLSLLQQLAPLTAHVGYYVNMTALATCVGIIFGLEAAIAIIALVKWIYELIPLT